MERSIRSTQSISGFIGGKKFETARKALLLVCLGILLIFTVSYITTVWQYAIPYWAGAPRWILPGCIVILSFFPVVAFLLYPTRSILIVFSTVFLLVIYYAIEAFLILYNRETDLYFDFYYFWFNRSAAFETFLNSYPENTALFIGGVLVLLSTICLLLLAKMLMRPHYAGRRISLVCLTVAGVVFVFAPGLPLKELISKAYATHRVVNYTEYQDYYKRSLQIKPLGTLVAETSDPIIMVQLESLNSEFVTPRITPEMYSFAREGILFTHHHSAGVQTHRAMESILCSSLPSLATSLYGNKMPAETVSSDEVLCLPAVLRAAGYRTLFFQNYDLSFQDIDDLVRRAGFEELHSTDIMQPGDQELEWGFREDIFYERIASYLSRYSSDDKLFIYIVTGAVNHFPFKLTDAGLRSELKQQLPYPFAASYTEERANATFVQDAYLANFKNAFTSLPFFGRAHVFLFGDHPIGIYRENKTYSFNVESVENKHFYTALAYHPPQQVKKPIWHGVVSEDRGTSHINLAPTILEIVGIKNPYIYSRSFLETMQSPYGVKATCVIDVQPFFNVGIALTEYPHKIAINLLRGTIDYIDLRENRETEERPHNIHTSLDKAKEYIESCLRNALLTPEV